VLLPVALARPRLAVPAGALRVVYRLREWDHVENPSFPLAKPSVAAAVRARDALSPRSGVRTRTSWSRHPMGASRAGAASLRPAERAAAHICTHPTMTRPGRNTIKERSWKRDGIKDNRWRRIAASPPPARVRTRLLKFEMSRHFAKAIARVYRLSTHRRRYE
jgi:hypothetical protein